MDFRALVRNFPLNVWIVGFHAVSCPYIHEDGLERRRKSDLLYLLVLLSPAARTFVLLVWRQKHVLSARNSSGLAEHKQSNDSAHVYRK